MGKLPHRLWSELVKAIVYIKNRLPSQAIGGRVPFEKLTGRKAKLSHLRILGCDAYTLFKWPGRSKLDEKADQMILVRYGDITGIYRLFDPRRNAIVVSRDVVFNEEGFVHKRYLPFEDHFGIGGNLGGMIFKQCSECGGMYHHAEDHYSEYPFWGQCCNAGLVFQASALTNCSSSKGSECTEGIKPLSQDGTVWCRPH